MNTNYTRDYSMLKHVPGMLQELAKLRSDKVLRRLHADAVAWHRAKIIDIKAREDWADFVEMTYKHTGQPRRAIRRKFSAQMPMET
jgi:hypothetical protein